MQELNQTQAPETSHATPEPTKKKTKLQQVAEFLKRYPNATPKETAEVLGMKLAHVYNLRSKLHRAAKPKKAKKVKLQTNDKAETTSQGAIIAVQKRTIESLQDEIGAWRNSYQNAQQQRIKLENELTEVKIAYLDLTAVVRYLERKIADFAKGE